MIYLYLNEENYATELKLKGNLLGDLGDSVTPNGELPGGGLREDCCLDGGWIVFRPNSPPYKIVLLPVTIN